MLQYLQIKLTMITTIADALLVIFFLIQSVPPTLPLLLSRLPKSASNSVPLESLLLIPTEHVPPIAHSITLSIKPWPTLNTDASPNVPTTLFSTLTITVSRPLNVLPINTVIHSPAPAQPIVPEMEPLDSSQTQTPTSKCVFTSAQKDSTFKALQATEHVCKLVWPLTLSTTLQKCVSKTVQQELLRTIPASVFPDVRLLSLLKTVPPNPVNVFLNVLVVNSEMQQPELASPNVRLDSLATSQATTLLLTNKSVAEHAPKQQSMVIHWKEFVWLKICVPVLIFMQTIFQDSARQNAQRVKIPLVTQVITTALSLVLLWLEITCTKTHRLRDVWQAVQSIPRCTKITELNLVWPSATIPALLLRPQGPVRPTVRTTFTKITRQESAYQIARLTQFQSIFTLQIQQRQNVLKHAQEQLWPIQPQWRAFQHCAQLGHRCSATATSAYKNVLLQHTRIHLIECAQVLA